MGPRVAGDLGHRLQAGLLGPRGQEEALEARGVGQQEQGPEAQGDQTGEEEKEDELLRKPQPPRGGRDEAGHFPHEHLDPARAWGTLSSGRAPEVFGVQALVSSWARRAEVVEGAPPLVGVPESFALSGGLFPEFREFGESPPAPGQGERRRRRRRPRARPGSEPRGNASRLRGCGRPASSGPAGGQQCKPGTLAGRDALRAPGVSCPACPSSLEAVSPSQRPHSTSLPSWEPQHPSRTLSNTGGQKAGNRGSVNWSISVSRSQVRLSKVWNRSGRRARRKRQGTYRWPRK